MENNAIDTSGSGIPRCDVCGIWPVVASRGKSNVSARESTFGSYFDRVVLFREVVFFLAVIFFLAAFLAAALAAVLGVEVRAATFFFAGAFFFVARGLDSGSSGRSLISFGGNSGVLPSRRSRTSCAIAHVRSFTPSPVTAEIAK